VLDEAAIGPRAELTCPADAVRVSATGDVQAAVDAHLGSTVFCILAGVHHVTRAVTPKTGNTFIGEPGAVLDGAGWQTSDPTQAAFRAHNEDIDRVTAADVQRVVRRYFVESGRTVAFTVQPQAAAKGEGK
jgi:hypothetical protein